MSTLTVIIITKNEAKNIKRTLESVKWADEIIIIDSGSTDNTLEICKDYTDKCFEMDWPGYGLQKQRALEKATKNWVLSIDADEVVPSTLKDEIQQKIKDTKASGFYIPVQLVFYGKTIKYANGSKHKLRLFKREKGAFSEDKVHEKVIVKGPLQSLSPHIEHYSFNNIDDILTKMNRYSSINASMHFSRGKKSSPFKAVTHGLWMFFRVYFINRGFLDGVAGLVLAVSFAESSYYRYMKQVYLEH